MTFQLGIRTFTARLPSANRSERNAQYDKICMIGISKHPTDFHFQLFEFKYEANFHKCSKTHS